MFKISKKAKKRVGIFLLICIPLFTFLLWPLDSPKYDIVFEQKQIDFVQDYLKNYPKCDTCKPPNIILILADDLGKTDISLYGNTTIQTPHMDAIGQNGVTFEEAYVSSPICSPSRAGLLTGKYQQRFGFENNIHERYPKNRLEYYVYKYFIATDQWQVADREIAVPSFEAMEKQGLPPTEFTMAELLKANGYATAIMGKWHLGYNDHAIPINRGFDTHYGFYEAFSLYAPIDDPGIINEKHDNFSDPFIWAKGRTGNCAIRLNDSIIEEPIYLTQRIAEESIAWMETQTKQQKPFFLYVPFSAPHTPFQATKAYYDKYKHIKDTNKRVYYAMISALDDAVGDLRKSVKDLGIEENTIIFFLSDNGGATYTKATDNAPLKGGKFTNFEGGLNVPFMIEWTGHISPSIQYKHPVSALDIFATAMAVSNTKLPENQTIDGKNLLPYLTDSTQNTPPHEALFWRSCYHKAIRKGDWKYIKDDKSGQQTLYNLKTDKVEHINVFDQYPAIIADLEATFAAWEKGMIAPKWPRVMDFKIEDGQAVYYFPL